MWCTLHPPLSRPPCPSPSAGGGGITWPMNNKKSIGNHRRRMHRRKILVGYTRIQVTVVWCASPPGVGRTVIPGGGSTSSIRQLLSAVDAQTAHHATCSTAPTHQLLGSANAETTPARAPAAAADRTQRPNDQHAKGRTGDRPGPRKGATTRRTVTRGVDMGGKGMVASAMIGFATWASHTRSSWEYHAVVATVSADDSTSEILGPWNLHGLTPSPACARATRPRSP